MRLLRTYLPLSLRHVAFSLPFLSTETSRQDSTNEPTHCVATRGVSQNRVALRLPKAWQDVIRADVA
jgi:hypothetical protein